MLLPLASLKRAIASVLGRKRNYVDGRVHFRAIRQETQWRMNVSATLSHLMLSLASHGIN